jgi:hypothetical protein
MHEAIAANPPQLLCTAVDGLRGVVVLANLLFLAVDPSYNGCGCGTAGAFCKAVGSPAASSVRPGSCLAMRS